MYEEVMDMTNTHEFQACVTLASVVALMCIIASIITEDNSNGMMLHVGFGAPPTQLGMGLFARAELLCSPALVWPRTYRKCEDALRRPQVANMAAKMLVPPRYTAHAQDYHKHKRRSP